MNKKAFIYPALLAVIFVVMVGVTFVNIYFNKLSRFDQHMGDKQSALLATIDQGEAVLYYVDQAAIAAAQQAAYDVAKQGSIDNPNCKKYEGYTLWNFSSERCYPQYVENYFKNMFDEHLNNVLSKNPINIPIPNYEILVQEQNNKLRIIGLAFHDVVLEIKGKESKKIIEKRTALKGCNPIQQQAYKNSQQYMAIYGTSEKEAKNQLVDVDFFGHTIPVHEKAQRAFECVVQDIEEHGCLETAKYNIKRAETFTWRANRNNPNELSLHSFGIAIDINPEENPNLLNECKTDIPDCLISSFKKFGFQWGCDFSGDHKDAMHFEWRGI